MKLLPTDKSNRTLLATELRIVSRDDKGRLEITIGYTGESTVANAIPLDHQVIPATVRAVNCHEDLLAACKAAEAKLVEYIPKEARGYTEGCFKYVAGGPDMWNCKCAVCQARAAIAKATA